MKRWFRFLENRDQEEKVLFYFSCYAFIFSLLGFFNSKNDSNFLLVIGTIMALFFYGLLFILPIYNIYKIIFNVLYKRNVIFLFILLSINFITIIIFNYFFSLKK